MEKKESLAKTDTMKAYLKRRVGEDRVWVIPKVKFQNCLKSTFRKFWVQEVVVGKKKKRKFSFRPCKQWNCRNCGPNQTEEFNKRLRSHIRSVPFVTYIVLTIDPNKSESAIKKGKTSASTIKIVQNIWKNLRVYLRRKYGKGKIKYVSTMEFQENRYAHLNVVINLKIDREWLLKSWTGLGGGSQISCQPITDKDRLPWYLSKSFTKGDFPKGTRRFSSSKGIQLSKKKGNNSEKSKFKSITLSNDLFKVNSDLRGQRITKIAKDSDDIVRSFETESD